MFVTYGIRSQLIVASMRDYVASMRDGTSVNEAAMRTVKIVYPNIFDVCCFSHTIDLVGEKFQLPYLVEFSTWWI